MRLSLLAPMVLALLAGAAMHRFGAPQRDDSRRAALNDVRSVRPAPAWRNQTWLNADSVVTLSSLRGRVVLLDFWTYACYNCTNTVPALNALDAAYRDRGLSVVGMHTPEFPPHGGEHDTTNVRRALTRHGIRYANAMDNDRATWKLYGIRYWPSQVLIDKRGQIRYEEYGEVHVGDRRYAQWQQRIEALLAE
jgi:thiol-disulfide isomerase/thioredoxin